MKRCVILFALIISVLSLNRVFAEDDFSDFDDFDDEFGLEEEGSPSKETFDPIMKYNRFMFKVNDKLYFWCLKPVAKGYGKIVPEKIRIMVRKFFKNIAYPIRLVNNVLQMKFNNALIETERFIINSTIGIIGFFDPAKSRFQLEPRQEDFGQTLGKYGVGEGFPVVIPFFGFSNVRDGLSMFADYYFNPVSYAKNINDRAAIIAFDKVNFLSLYPDVYEKLKKEALDPYTFMRDLYSKDRTNKIRE